MLNLHLSVFHGSVSISPFYCNYGEALNSRCITLYIFTIVLSSTITRIHIQLVKIHLQVIRDDGSIVTESNYREDDGYFPSNL